jgi:FkbM family methyltransferase
VQYPQSFAFHDGEREHLIRKPREVTIREMQLLKRFVKEFARRCGYEILNREAAPFGHDFALDVKRLGTSWQRPIDVVFDVGANVGQTAARISDAFPDARIFAFEPTPATCAQLRSNTRHARNIKTFELALGATSGTAQFYTYDSSLLNSLVPNARYPMRFGPAPSSTEVQVTTIDEFCDSNGLDHIAILKIDTEGFDLPVLQGARRLLANRKVDFVYIEFNDVSLKEGTSGGALAPICEFLIEFDLHFIASYTDQVVLEGELFVVSNALLARK